MIKHRNCYVVVITGLTKQCLVFESWLAEQPFSHYNPVLTPDIYDNNKRFNRTFKNVSKPLKLLLAI